MLSKKMLSHHIKAQHSKEKDNCAHFASCGCEALETEYIDDG